MKKMATMSASKDGEHPFQILKTMFYLQVCVLFSQQQNSVCSHLFRLFFKLLLFVINIFVRRRKRWSEAATAGIGWSGESQSETVFLWTHY